MNRLADVFQNANFRKKKVGVVESMLLHFFLQVCVVLYTHGMGSNTERYLVRKGKAKIPLLLTFLEIFLFFFLL